MKILCFILIASNISFALASCPDGSYKWQNGCYFFQTDVNNFALATANCQSLGGNLVSIHDGFTNTYLAQQGQSLFLESTMADFWIGLTNLMPSKNWTWVDNTTFDFTDWASGEPRNVTDSNCASLDLTTGLWYSKECYKLKPYVCGVKEKNVFETTPSEVETTRSTFIPNPNCVYSTLNMYLNYFFDTGGAPTELFTLFNDIVTETSGYTGVGNPTRLLSIYGANANGSAPAAIPFAQIDELQNELFPLLGDPYFTALTSSITADLTYYQSVLTGQLTYPTVPVIVIFLRNPLDDLNASIAKMNEVKYANPKTYFMGVFFSSDPTISQLPFDYTLNIVAAAHTTVINIMNFICQANKQQF